MMELCRLSHCIHQRTNRHPSDEKNSLKSFSLTFPYRIGMLSKARRLNFAMLQSLAGNSHIDIHK
jgi:hypothetical protein